ncbi:hypothetical protein L2E82_22881 [Cichorium intybus]|uniref:Uncharacterized protein n=1 Tax=Cichorium intybus TaxID=13427 RepID=A0ACB9DZA3_CICIN|nr:hypothetical protein L2E82_22881 [Cichorium intybus]
MHEAEAGDQVMQDLHIGVEFDTIKGTHFSLGYVHAKQIWCPSQKFEKIDYSIPYIDLEKKFLQLDIESMEKKIEVSIGYRIHGEED